MTKRGARQLLLIIIIFLVMHSVDGDIRFRLMAGVLAIGFTCVLFMWGDYDE